MIVSSLLRQAGNRKPIVGYLNDTNLLLQLIFINLEVIKNSHELYPLHIFTNFVSIDEFTTVEEKKKTSLDSICDAKIVVKNEIEELKNRLKLSRETIDLFKKQLSDAQENSKPDHETSSALQPALPDSPNIPVPADVTNRLIKLE